MCFTVRILDLSRTVKPKKKKEKKKREKYIGCHAGFQLSAKLSFVSVCV